MLHHRKGFGVLCVSDAAQTPFGLEQQAGGRSLAIIPNSCKSFHRSAQLLQYPSPADPEKA
jgi:hypothetical protein